MLKNWKTTLAGVGAALFTVAMGVYQHGMTAKQWASAVGLALIGILAKDHDSTT